MNAREYILGSIRRHLPSPAPLPELAVDGITFVDPPQQFAAVLSAVGGRCIPVPDGSAIDRELDALPEYASATKIVSLVPGVGRANVDLEAIDDPHRLEDVDFAILPGEFGVAENAAVWITDRHVKHRAVYFLCQHLALVVPAREIVDNMHQAYDRLSFNEPRFGAFLSGPSKTADIEQSLVIGAHGPRSLTVFLVDCH